MQDIVRPLHISTYNALPAVHRRTVGGQVFAFINREWCRVALVRPERRKPLVKPAA